MTFKLPRRLIAAFVLPAIPTAALGLPIVVVLPHFYEKHVGLSFAATGLVFMLARFWDVFTDPVVGILSDKFRTPWGRRRPWLVASVPVLMLSVAMLFMPAEGVGIGYLAFWVAVLYVGYTMIGIPHLAWATELAPDYHERSRIHGWREFALLTGMFSVLALPALVEALDLADGEAARAAAMGLFIIVALPLTVLPAVLFVHEPAPVHGDTPNWRAALRVLRKNRALRHLLAADFLINMSMGVTGTLYFYMIAGVLKLENASLLLLLYFVAGTLGVPFWMRLSYRVGKHRAFAYAMAFSVVLSPLMLLLPVGAFWPALALFMLAGLAYGASSFLCRAIMADVCDQNTLETGQQQTGLYFSLLTLTLKLGYALAVGLALPLLGLIGFDSSGPNPSGTEWGFRLIFVLIPMTLTAAAGLALWRFPLGEKEHNRLRAALAERVAAQGPPVPPRPVGAPELAALRPTSAE